MEETKSSIGSIVGTIIIIGLIILGGLYFWGKRIEESRATQNLTTDNTPEPATEVSETAKIKNMSSSDDLSSIDADLQNTNTENLSTEVQ